MHKLASLASREYISFHLFIFLKEDLFTSLTMPMQGNMCVVRLMQWKWTKGWKLVATYAAFPTCSGVWNAANEVGTFFFRETAVHLLHEATKCFSIVEMQQFPKSKTIQATISKLLVIRLRDTPYHWRSKRRSGRPATVTPDAVTPGWKAVHFSISLEHDGRTNNICHNLQITLWCNLDACRHHFLIVLPVAFPSLRIWRILQSGKK